jgi:hypothetical protein
MNQCRFARFRGIVGLAIMLEADHARQVAVRYPVAQVYELNGDRFQRFPNSKQLLHRKSLRSGVPQ